MRTLCSIPSKAWWPSVAIGLVTAVLLLARPADLRLTDLSVYLGAVGGMTEGASLYDYVRADAPFTYPPFAGLVFQPLTWFAVPVVQVAWSLATVAVVPALARLTTARHVAPLLAVALALSAPVSSNLKFGQVSLFLAALVAVDVLMLGRTRGHGVLIGVAAAVKLTPLIFIPMLWFGGHRRAAVTAATTFAACGALAAAVLPGDSWRYWSTEMTRVDRLGHITGAGNQSLNGALMRLDVAAHAPIALAAGGALAAVALWCAARFARRGDRRSALIVTGVAAVVLSPVSWTHHQVWLVLAVLLPVGAVLRAATVAVMLLPVTALGGPVFGNARLLLAVAVIVGAVVAIRRSGEQVGEGRIRWPARAGDPAGSGPAAAVSSADEASAEPGRVGGSS